MKKTVLTILLGSLLCVPMMGQKELTTKRNLIFGELRLDDEPFPWENFKLVGYDFHIIKEKYADAEIVDDIEVHVYAKERYYPTAGTEILISSDKEFPGIFNLKGGYIVTLKEKDTIHITDHIIPIDITDAKEINKNTQKLTHSIDINAPEKLSLVVLMNYINEKLHVKTTKNNGFSDVVLNLEKYWFAYAKKEALQIPFDELPVLYELSDFISVYITEDAYFIEEADKLNQHISDLNQQLKDQNKMQALNDEERESFNNDLISSNRVYVSYQETYQELKTYYDQLQSILHSAYSKVQGAEATMPTKKWRTDISLGPAFSHGSNSKDQMFELLPIEINGSEFFMLLEIESDVFTSGSIAALIVHSRNTEKAVAIGFNYGIGANFRSDDDINVGFFGGGSLLIGKSKAIIINAGLSVLSVQRLSDKFNGLEQNVFNTNDVEGTISTITEREFKLSPFFSITYNLTRKK